MTRRNLIGFALSLNLAALLTGCGGQLPAGAVGPTQQPALATRADNSHYKVVYSFGGGSDGAHPVAGLIDVAGTLYGTTIAGGGSFYCTNSAYYGCGTVYSLRPDGTEKVLHSFGATGDGQNPQTGLIEAGSALYGTTTFGGSYPCYGSYYASCGTLFSITTGGVEKVLHSFSGYPTDGARPDASLSEVAGMLYGTTGEGGRGECYYSGEACGTVYAITTNGEESVLHGFTSSPDGAFPHAGLIEVKGTLYGTTAFGGENGYGTVFSITMDGTEKVLHSFGAGRDGRSPYAALIDVNGKLYGTTAGGGAYSCGSHAGCGTLFSITLGGSEKVLHSFGSGTDGARPQASLIELDGKLYGTTRSGGSYTSRSNSGYGTVFSITPRGAEKVLHSFAANPDGAWPEAGLIDVHGTLYGTTDLGGAHGNGTVFSLKP